MEDFNSQYANHSKLEQLKQFILEHGTYIELKKGEQFTIQGKVNHRGAYIEHGLLRYTRVDEKGNNVTPEVLKQRMKDHITTIVTRYKGRIKGWDVVNEAVNDDGTMRTSSNWYKVYGDAGYVTDAFTFARKYADKDVKLFLNDYNEYAAAKRDRIYQVVKDLYDKGLCDGVGMQSHYSMTSPTIAAVKVAIQKYNQIDPGKIEIQLTELDIHNTFRTAADQKSVATKYQSLFNMLVDSRRNQKINITGVTFWGLTDGDSWLSDFKGETSYPLLFGADYAAKSAYFAVLNAAK